MKLLKALGIIITVVVILMAAAAMLLNTDSVQNWLMQRVVTILKEHLQTEVRVGHVSVSFFKGSVTLDDVEVDDRQGRKMFRMESLTATLDGLRGFVIPGQHELVVTDARVSGLKAQLCKPASPTDSTANYQFLVEALKSPKSHKTQKEHKSRTSISFLLEAATIDIDSLCYTTDNGRARRNTGKPHHGAFDAGHLDICTQAKLKLSIQPSIFNLQCSIFNLQDRGSGLQVDSLRLQADIVKDSLHLSDVEIRLPHTTLSFADGWVVVGNASERCSSDTAPSIRYHIPKLTATTQIRDIAQPFAPVLKDFTTPLQVQCAFSGDADGMDFKDIQVSTSDRHLHINATGRISHLRDKHQLHVHFDVGQMTAHSGMPERIINHFPVKKHMMKQMNALGSIGYRGHFDVVYKKESFAGHLRTEHGDIDFHFALDENNKYLSGTASTDSLQLGRIMDVEHLGRIVCRADFRFDISKPRTAEMRRLKGGKLPIGNIEAEVQEAHYKSVAVHNLSATIESDGAEATGCIVDKGKHIDLSCTFSFTDTDEMHKLKVKPGISFHRKKKE